MQNKDSKFIFLVIFAILGIMISLQFRSTLNTNKQKALAVYTAEGLKKQIEEQQKATEAILKEINDIENKRDEQFKLSADSNNDDTMKRLLEQLVQVNIKAGLTDVKGQGVIVKMDDASARNNEKPRDLIIHDFQVVRILNELKKAGAQAISVNGERIIPTSEQICAGPTIRINKNRYAVPYEIKAIGNADAMYEDLEKSKTIAGMKELKVRIDFSKSKEVIVPKYVDNLDRISSNLEVVK